MTRPVVLDDILEVRFQALSVNQVSQNVIHYKITNIVGAPLTDQEVADGLSDLVAPLYLAWFSVDTQYLGLRLQKIAPSPKATHVLSVEGADFGALDEDDLPPQNCAAVVKLTEEAARRFRGFVFLPFFTELHLDEGGQLSPAGQTLVETWCGTVLTPIVIVVGAQTVTLTPVIHSRGDGTVLVVDAPITGFRVQSWFVTHRSRGLNRRGDILGP